MITFETNPNEIVGLSDDLTVGDTVTLLVTASIVKIEDELVDVTGHGSTRIPEFKFGTRTLKFVVTDAMVAK